MSRRNSLEPLTLIVEPDNICNTNIFDSDDGRILYQVMTPAKPSSTGEYITTLYNVYGDTIATLVWRTDSSKRDYIVIGSNPTMLVQSWLRKSSVPFKDRDVISFQDPTGRQYKWKGNAPGLPLELFDSDRKQPIATFEKARPKTMHDAPDAPERIPSQLLLERRSDSIRDLVILSFIILEKARRSDVARGKVA